MEDKKILSYDEYNVSILVFYFWFFVITALMVFLDYELLVYIDTIFNFWLVPIVWTFNLIPSIFCLVCLNSLYYDRNMFYSTEFIVKRRNTYDE